jgi:hypothetical protein
MELIGQKLSQLKVVPSLLGILLLDMVYQEVVELETSRKLLSAQIPWNVRVIVIVNVHDQLDFLELDLF